jgi:hypothetical protein
MIRQLLDNLEFLGESNTYVCRCVISSFYRDLNELLAFLGCYAVQTATYLPIYAV